MTTWSVVNDDTQESGHRRCYFRYAVFTLAALLVMSLGFVLIPREPDAPAPPPFTEQARAAAFSDAVDLRAAGIDLAGTADGGLAAAESGEVSAEVSSAISRTVTLLTMQARALMLPGDPSGTGTSSAAVPLPSTPADLAAALHSSGAQRLSDAQTADGGMARLLAGAGTAQLLAAEELAAATGVPLAGAAAAARPPAKTSSHDPTPTAGCTATATSGNAGPGGTESGDAGSGGAGVDLASSLASALDAELELVYAYQAALTRLKPASVAPASDFLAQHEELRNEAGAMGAARCAALLPTPAGYALDQAFLSGPAAALGTMEAGALAVYGDVIALSDGPERAWALSALQSAARRTVHWGASAGPVPGVTVDESRLPELPGTAPTQGPGPTSSRQP
ncbi:DUF4439 domain-containing protein [Pseudarthrobacter sulfonivorans]|uniref:DUF4439 domain-containing protein n=1 Tax=Pseudarthrobacter sulfonivorans TaxID=121292 RepID=UPI00286049AB|nr:DUF4439 domain-containing protein [Pseudarthrobacter sulfonivorans]MDR6416263.1 hypothetical protein [Pseudarthrobacter sulfonivorans]